MRVLIVSSDISARRQIVRTFEDKMHCDVACSGQEALEHLTFAFAEEDYYNLAIIDYEIEGLPADDVIESLRDRETELSLDWSKCARIIAIGQDEKKLMKAFFKGADAALTLPLGADTLVKQAKALDIPLT